MPDRDGEGRANRRGNVVLATFELEGDFGDESGPDGSARMLSDRSAVARVRRMRAGVPLDRNRERPKHDLGFDAEHFPLTFDVR